MSTITVVKVQDLTPEQRARAVYIGRRNARYELQRSPLANIFRIAPDAPRREVIARYRDWLQDELRHPTAAREELERLVALAQVGDVQLMCWCAPQRCHGDVLKAIIEARLREHRDA